jgi:hypothetical protein
VLAFVSVNVWRSIISCQIFREAGNVRRKNENGRASIRISKTVERIGEITKLKASILKDLSTEKATYAWKRERKVCPA